MKGTVIYLHGFGSVGESPKTEQLREGLPGVTVIAPDLPVTPAEVVSLIDNVVRSVRDFPVVFVGTSLGGFWANYFAQRYDAPCIIVNPAVQPSVSLAERVGKVFKNYGTGEDVVVTEEDISGFGFLEAYLRSNTNGALINLFVAKDDDVVNAAAVLKSVEFAAAKFVFPDGGHRFEQHWSTVVKWTKEVLNDLRAD